ncbi:MAG TPA: hypothetical protein VFD92_04685 [Candidatus Binatia bacterium]|nr:hypothetical protein [Candidatus Binatia bacterium]
MEATDAIKVAAALAPIVSQFVKEVEHTDASSEEKKAAVMGLTETVYRGAQALGTLDGVKELRGVDFSTLAPLFAILVDGVVALFKAVRIFVSKRKAAPAAAPAK